MLNECTWCVRKVMTLNAWLDNWQHLRRQPRHTFLLDDQCKFQHASINTSDLTASCVSVCSSDALRKWRNEISSSVARSNFVSNLMKTQQKLTKNWKGLMESMVYQGHRFLGGIKHFWMAVRVWKTSLVLEDLARQKRTKMWPKWGISWGPIDVWQSEWSVVCWIWIAKPSTKFCPSNWACRKFVSSGPKNSHQ